MGTGTGVFQAQSLGVETQTFVVSRELNHSLGGRAAVSPSSLNVRTPGMLCLRVGVAMPKG